MGGLVIAIERFAEDAGYLDISATAGGTDCGSGTGIWSENLRFPDFRLVKNR